MYKDDLAKLWLYVYFSGVTGMEKSRTSLDASAVAVPGVIGVRTDCVQSQPGNKFILAINYTEKHFLWISYVTKLYSHYINLSVLVPHRELFYYKFQLLIFGFPPLIFEFSTLIFFWYVITFFNFRQMTLNNRSLSTSYW